MRDIVNNEDIQEAYLFVKEILHNNYYSTVNGKRETVNKTKRNKMTFVMDKIRQYCSNYNTKNLNKKIIIELSEEYINRKDDLDIIIETLNYNGFLIKTNTDEYQIN